MWKGYGSYVVTGSADYHVQLGFIINYCVQDSAYTMYQISVFQNITFRNDVIIATIGLQWNLY